MKQKVSVSFSSVLVFHLLDRPHMSLPCSVHDSVWAFWFRSGHV